MSEDRPKWYNMLHRWWYEKKGRGFTLPYLIGSCTRSKSTEAIPLLLKSMAGQPDPSHHVLVDRCAHLLEFVFVLEKGRGLVHGTSGRPLPAEEGKGLHVTRAWSDDYCRLHAVARADLRVEHLAKDLADEYGRFIAEGQFSRMGRGAWGPFTEEEIEFITTTPGYLI